MNEERKVIDSNAIVVFEQPTIYASKLNELLKDFYGDVVINGDLYLDEKLCLKCDLYVIDGIECKSAEGINIQGDLECCGYMDTYEIFVGGCLYCEGEINSTDIKVGENLLCEDQIETNGCYITVAGDFECKSVEAGKIYVLGRVKVENVIEAERLEIGC